MVRGMFLSLNPTLETCEKSVATCLLRPAKGNVLSAKGNVLSAKGNVLSAKGKWFVLCKSCVRPRSGRPLDLGLDLGLARYRDLGLRPVLQR